MIDVRDHIKAIPRETPRCDSELIFIDLLLHCNRTITLGVFYRSPNDETKHLEALQAALQHIGTANEFIIVRDFSPMREENTLDLLLASTPDYVKSDRW